MFLSHAYAASHCSLLTPSATILPSLLLASPTKVQGPVTCRGLSCSLGSHFRRHRGLGFLSQLLHPSRFHRKGVRTSLLPAPASPFCPCASMSPWSLPSLTGFREGGGINACVKYVSSTQLIKVFSPNNLLVSRTFFYLFGCLNNVDLFETRFRSPRSSGIWRLHPLSTLSRSQHWAS